MPFNLLPSSISLAKSVLRQVGLLPYAKRAYGALMRDGDKGLFAPVAYRIRSLVERANFSDVEVVHDLPQIHHYWSNKYLRPKCEALGFSDTDSFYLTYSREALRRGRDDGTARIISVGAGNGDLEVRLARNLLDQGVRGFQIECLDMNQSMLARCLGHAQAAGVSEYITAVQGDFNKWSPDRPDTYRCVIANQSLHHVLDLEHLFASIQRALAVSGLFLSADMIGRNGHQRWPEARKILDEYWATLPRPRKYNHQLSRFEEDFKDWDCSVSGFEGIRAQDVLPLLVERFGFEVFLGFGGVIDPFIDRGFGPNYNVEDEDDLRLIDRIAIRNDIELARGVLKPTQMYAVMCRDRSTPVRCWENLTPARAIRQPAAAVA